MLISIYLVLVSIIGIMGAIFNNYELFKANKKVEMILNILLSIPFYLIIIIHFSKGIL